jgi:hypothetical protein
MSNVAKVEVQFSFPYLHLVTKPVNILTLLESVMLKRKQTRILIYYRSKIY